MTQEELDALINEGVDDISEEDEQSSEQKEDAESETEAEDNTQEDKKNEDNGEKDYRIDANKPWPPPPPTDDHKVVHQLDDVTRDSELKAGELFDKLESVSSIVMEMEEQAAKVNENLDKDKELFEKLSKSFPHIQSFKDGLERNKENTDIIQKMTEDAQSAGDETMMAMDGMQYQDIHRQKIERVINVMRALSKYMHSLFEGQVEDDKRVGSAVHLDGDTGTDGLVSDDDIEELISTLGKK